MKSCFVALFAFLMLMCVLFMNAKAISVLLDLFYDRLTPELF